MNDTTDQELGLIEVHLDKLNHFVIPQALAIKEKVEAGEELDDFDIEFLEESLEYHRSVLRDFHQHPEFEKIALQLSMLYNHIVDSGAHNQHNE